MSLKLSMHLKPLAGAVLIALAIPLSCAQARPAEAPAPAADRAGAVPGLRLAVNDHIPGVDVSSQPQKGKAPISTTRSNIKHALPASGSGAPKAGRTQFKPLSLIPK